MKIHVSSSPKKLGTILVVALMTTSIIGLLLAGYLSMTIQQYRTTLRSQYWNGVMPTVEAGIEEALTHMNKNCVSNTVIAQPVNFTSDGWLMSSNNVYEKRASLGDGYYIVTIDFNNPYSPIIESQGFIYPPMAACSSWVQFAQVASTTFTAPPISRKVRVKTGHDSLIAKAMFAKGTIDLNGNNVETDSFDSVDPNHSTGGQYDATKRNNRGDLATNLTLTNSLNVGNANIYGSVSTGPGGTISIGSNGSVGDAAWVDSGTHGIQPGHSTDDMNVYVPEVVLPFVTPTATPLRNVTLTNPIVQWLLTTNFFAGYGDAQQAQVLQGGSITTNTVIATNSTYPSAGTYAGTVLVNTRLETNNSYPASGIFYGAVTTNLNSQTSPTYPSTYYGVVVTNLAMTTTTNSPSLGTYVGNITTNYTSKTTTSYPSTSPVTTNTQFTTTSSAPSSGTYVGSVTTNSTWRTNQKYPPAAGTYVSGSLSQRSNGRYDYQEITSYSYYKITSYSAPVISSYTYNAIVSYFYQTIRDYTYNLIVGYTYNAINGYNLVGKLATTNYVVKLFNYVFDTGDYEWDNLSGTVLVRGDARVHVTQGMSFTGQDSIEINSGASLKLYVSAASASIKGNGVLNYNGNASSFYYYGLAENTSLSIGGNGGVTGIVYAPQADFQLGGGGNNDIDFVGASITKTVQMNGHFHFHYDENLERVGPSRGYLITEWNEILK